MPVSVVIPTYQRAGVVGRAITSALRQGDAVGEVIVVDDGSTDETRSSIADEARRDRRVIAIDMPHRGVGAAREVGIARARHEMIAFLDSDDEWLPGKLVEQLSSMRTQDWDLSFTSYCEIRGNAKRVVQLDRWPPSRDEQLELLLQGCCMTTSTVVARAALLRRVGGFKVDMPVCKDWDLWIRIVLARARVGYIPKPLTRYFVTAESASGDVASFNSAAERVISLASNRLRSQARCVDDESTISLDAC